MFTVSSNPENFQRIVPAVVTLPVSLLASFEEAVCLQAEGNVFECRRPDFLGKFLAMEMVTCWNKKSSLRDEEPNFYCYSYFLIFGGCYVFVVPSFLYSKPS